MSDIRLLSRGCAPFELAVQSLAATAGGGCPQGSGPHRGATGASSEEGGSLKGGCPGRLG